MRTHLLPALLLTCLLYACSPITVLNQEPAPGFNLSNYRTFNFYEIETSGDTIAGPLYRTGIAALRTEITRQLQLRGLQLSNNEPDLLLNVGIVIEDKDPRTAGPRYMGQRRYDQADEDTTAGGYTEGTVTVHLVDRKENRLVWQGAVEGVVPDKPVRLQDNVADAMTALFKGMP